ncbi:MAG: efflux RND transporter periplasmic adaptor subunit [Rhodanobacteraceae bacterium]
MTSRTRTQPSFAIRLPSLAFLATCLLLTACSHKGNKDADAAVTRIPVEAAVATRAPMDASFTGTATLEAVAEADVVAKTTGVLLQMSAEEGMPVNKGQLLAQLDDRDARAEMEQSAALMRKAKANYEYAKRSITRHLIPQRDFDQARYEYESQRAAYEGARVRLSYTRIVAPIAGVISRREVKLGNPVKQNDTLFHIVDMQPLQAVLNVPESELGTLKVDQTVGLAVDALPGRHFEGRVARVAPVIDAGTGTFRVTTEFSDPGGSLRPGMFARLRIVHDQRRDALVIPRTALVEEDGETAVFLVEPGDPAPVSMPKPLPGDAMAAEHKPAVPLLVAHRRTVKLGYSNDSQVEIRDGLKPGDQVITLGRNAVRDGAAVQILDSAPAVSASQADPRS